MDVDREGGRQAGLWALVTGASSGIGWELARDLAGEGYNLVVTARREEALETLARGIRETTGQAVHVIPADLARTEGVEAVLEGLDRLQVEVTLLVNNAGFGDYGPFAQADLGRTLQMVSVNVTSLTHLTRALLPPMVERGSGRILNVASTAAFQPGPLMAVYYATKAYVLAFSEALRDELRGQGVTVTTLCPGPTTSEFHAEAGMMASPLVQRFPMPSSRAVARYGVRAALKGKGIAVYGILNRLHVFGLRFLPRALVVRLVRRVQEIRSS